MGTRLLLAGTILLWVCLAVPGSPADGDAGALVFRRQSRPRQPLEKARSWRRRRCGRSTPFGASSCSTPRK